MQTTSSIDGVEVRKLELYFDERGWLAELYRADEWPQETQPRMGYLSVTKPGVTRGPHEHVDQTDVFCFPGPGLFEIRLWDRRPESPSQGQAMKLTLGEGNPAVLVIPPGVVHGYRNISGVDALVINLPNRLYRGVGKAEEVDEIRHEENPHSPYTFED
ncbi:MAG: dTDP-4-dehydrorhamnose 3,5-epimerase family protein [Anaerolineales bacterium]|nr:dTDP-4-dehydrorhamnose 3,5-epimerase family protein [Anaerolineales bacterium]